MSVELWAEVADLRAVLKFGLFSGEPVFNVRWRPLAYTASFARKSLPRVRIVVAHARTYQLGRDY